MRNTSLFLTLNARAEQFSADLSCLKFFHSSMVSAEFFSVPCFALSDLARVQEIYVKHLEDEFLELQKALLVLGKQEEK